MSAPEFELACAAATAADDRSASDIVVLDVSSILDICDAFVICSASNTRLVAAIANEVEEQLRELHDIKPVAIEGLDSRRWVLMDYGSVLVHIFLDEERDYYRLERLYNDAPRLDWQE